MPEKLRLRFEKTGRAIYISHLDLMRTMQRVFLRADCPLKYSEGFNPHALISILLPLSVGVGSVCELMDFQLREDVDLAALPERLTAVMPEGIRALEAYPAGRKVRELKWLRVTGRYEYDRADPAEMARKLSAFYAQDAIVITRKTKRGEGQMDIVPAIAELHIRPEETCVTVEAVVSAQEPTLNPDHLVAALQQLAPELAQPLFAHFDGLPETDCFVLFDAMCHVPPSAVSKELFAAAEPPLLRMLRSGVDRWQINALRCIHHLRSCADGDFLRKAAQPRGEETPAVTYLREKLFGDLPTMQPDVSLLYLSNLKNAVHWIVKIEQIDMLCDDVRQHSENAFHTAMHLSNLLSVSEHLPVREHAGEALLTVADYLTVDQRNEIAVDLLRELENGQEQIARFIPPYLGRLVCSLPEKEIMEAVDYLEALLRSGTVRPAGPALSALGSLIASLPEGSRELIDRCLGLLLVGVAHYHAPIHQSALCVLCHDLIANEALPLRLRSYCFTRIHKKLLTLLSEPEPGQLSFFNRAAMLNHLYRFMVHYTVEQGAFQFEAPKPVAFFPGTFDPFSAGHKAIVEEIRVRGFEVYLAVDEFSWSKRTLAKLLRRRIVRMSVADQWDTYLFPDDIPINIAMPEDLRALRACFPGRQAATLSAMPPPTAAKRRTARRPLTISSSGVLPRRRPDCRPSPPSCAAAWSNSPCRSRWRTSARRASATPSTRIWIFPRWSIPSCRHISTNTACICASPFSSASLRRRICISPA